jgi:hypothetical protein
VSLKVELLMTEIICDWKGDLAFAWPFPVAVQFVKGMDG